MITITVLFIILSIICGLIGFIGQCTWGLIKVLFYIFLAPVVLIGIIIPGLTYMAIIALMIMAVGTVIKKHV